MSKKFLAMFLAIIMVLGTMPVLSLMASADEPIKVGAIIAAAGYNFVYDEEAGCSKIAVDFYFGDGEAKHDDMADILDADPEIVPGTMAANLADYTFSVTLTNGETVVTNAPSKVEVKDDWGALDQGIWFYLDGFDLETAKYTVRVDIVTPSGNAYYYEEANLSCTVPGVAGALGLWGAGYENWSGQTQFLLRPVDWTGAKLADVCDNYKNYTWVVTVNGVDHVEEPSTFYDHGTIVRFQPCCWDDPVYPEYGETFEVDLTIYDAEDAVVYTSAFPATISINDEAFEPIIPDRIDTLGLWGNGYENWGGDPQTQFLLCPHDWKGRELTDICANYRDYTWVVTVNGVEHTELPSSFYGSMIVRFQPCLWDDPVYPEYGESFEVSLAIYDADGDAVYEAGAPVTISIDNPDFEPIFPVMIDTLGLWGSGYENWGSDPQTQLLLCPKNWKGNKLEDICDNAADYTWVVTVDGTDYTVQPSSIYDHGTIVRFEPCLWTTPFIPQAGESYVVSLTIYDADGDAVYEADEPVTIAFADDFEVIVPEPAFATGDINGDGEVNIQDVTALLNVLAGKGVATGASCDLDGDEVISINDVTKLLNILAGKA